ncbi:hypothetical protein AB1Y20_015849 [Prymnesium parvum]|uniref:Protein kinase domain-containing protein n=1 Tax=Prymnesium parvum TaxID=97485 RepID=A0AB34K454_PRYPA
MNSLFSFSGADASLAETHAAYSAAIREKNAERLAALFHASPPRAATLNHVPDAPSLPLLLLAAMHDADGCVDVLLAAKADPNVADAAGTTACYIAARNDASRTLARLLAAGADANKPRASGATPLYVASQNDARAAVRALLQGGAAADAAKEGGFTPLHIATLRNRKECVSALLHARADVNRPYAVADRFTPLMLAAHCNFVEVLGVLVGAGAELGSRDAQGRTAHDIATALGHEMVRTMLDVRIERQQRDTQMALQEDTLQELRHLTPVQADLEVESSRIEALQMQAAQFRSQESIFADASELQSACLLIAQNVLPAERMATELSDMDAETAKMEVQVEAARSSLEKAQAALRASPTDPSIIYERDAARGIYMESLTALKAQYEERQSRGARYAAASEKVAAAVGGRAAAEAEAREEPGLVEALTSSLPVLKTIIRDIGDANRKTVEAMDALAAAMARELALMEQVRTPLARAKGACHAAIRGGAHKLLADKPREDLAQVALLLGDVRAREQKMERAQMLLLEANRGLSAIEETANEEVRIADELDEVQLALNKAMRHGDAAETQHLEGRKEMLKASLASLHDRNAQVRKALSDPLLAEAFPETKRLHDLKTGAGRVPPGGVDPTARFHSYELSTELSRSAGRRVLLARPRPQGSDVVLTELQMARSDAFLATQLAVAALNSPLLLAPTKLVYDPSFPSQTYAIEPLSDWYLSGSSSLAEWVQQARGRADALTQPPAGDPPRPPLLASKLAPLFIAVSTLHRHGILHGALSPEAVRVRPDGSLALGCTGFRTSATMGPYDAPEVFHDPSAHRAAPLAADAWSLGAVLLELLTGVTPRWNQMMNYLEDAVLSRPLLPPEVLGDDALGVAWKLTLALTERDPRKRLTVHAALQSPVFDALRPKDALSVLAPRCRPAQLTATRVARSDTPAWLSAAEGELEGNLAPQELELEDGREEALPLAVAQASSAMREPLRVHVTSDGDSAQLVDLTLSVAAELELEDTLLLVNASGEERPAAELLGRFFTAAASPASGLLAAEEGGATLLPLTGPATDESKAKARTFGRLLGYAACHAIAVPLPLSAAFFYFLTAEADLSEDVGVFSLAEGQLELSDGVKGEAALRVARHLLVGRRREHLAAIRDGVHAILSGADLSLLKPSELALRLLGWEPQPDGIECSFEEDDWEDADLLAAYSCWLSEWTAALPPAGRCALRMLLKGTAMPPAGHFAPLRTSVICSPGPAVHFLPETEQLYVPMACSADEFTRHMDAALA